MHARAAIAAMVATMNASDLDQKLSVGSGPLAFRPPTPRVVEMAPVSRTDLRLC